MNIIEPTFRNVMGHETYVFNVCIIVYCDIVIVQLFFCQHPFDVAWPLQTFQMGHLHQWHHKRPNLVNSSRIQTNQTQVLNLDKDPSNII